MLEQELEFERNIFLFLNGNHTLFADQFFWLFSGKAVWIPVAAVLLGMMIYSVICKWNRKIIHSEANGDSFMYLYPNRNKWKWKEAVLLLLAIAVAIALCDQFASGVCKPFFHRFRPSQHPDFMNDVQTVFNYRGGRFGFISSHAANSFGFVTLTSLIFRNKMYTFSLYLWATVNSYSRIYLGVHFISDVIAGIAAGIFFGWVAYKLYILAYNRFINKELSSKQLENSCFTISSKKMNAILITLALTVVFMITVSALYSMDCINAITVK